MRFIVTRFFPPPATMATITKRDIVNHITDKLENPTQHEVAEVVQATIDCITAALARADEIALRNFGGFEVRYTPPKIGRNPRDAKTPIPIPGRAVVKFKPGKVLRDKVAQVLPRLQAGK